ncbi:MAG: hypothetical protein COW03_15865 [Cytophagales bacterium CG12_big_fil_rev_8_21_14_0_65_40_12]|nr:MAG: hypothetical protein COW03_15865 [Cytophagales bacterium CG12_big_fil_rev_8_21_14_0_65_40_12]PIW04825.1 MAG: hypothetical protein COW40_08145 [Cytophagales bacterium CG17_big_fil_post_rev_8_21_14_2_50_40_13]
MKLTKTLATSLLITYVVILFGYGLSSLTHMWLHAVQNPSHSHGHVHVSKTENNGLHSVSDHSKTLSKLNEGSQDLGTTESNTIVFAFVFWKSPEPLLITLDYSTAEKKYMDYLVHYNSRGSKPSTPPPLS